MRGLTDVERFVIASLTGRIPVRRSPTREESEAAYQLFDRGVLSFGDLCRTCGQHRDITTTAHGLEVERLDKIARGEIPL